MHAFYASCPGLSPEGIRLSFRSAMDFYTLLAGAVITRVNEAFEVTTRGTLVRFCCSWKQTITGYNNEGEIEVGRTKK